MVQDYERVVIFRLGRILGGGARFSSSNLWNIFFTFSLCFKRGPGLFFVLPCTDIFEIIDMRVSILYFKTKATSIWGSPQVQNFSVPPQEMITKDSVTVYVNAIMYYKVLANINSVQPADRWRTRWRPWSMLTTTAALLRLLRQRLWGKFGGGGDGGSARGCGDFVLCPLFYLPKF